MKPCIKGQSYNKVKEFVLEKLEPHALEKIIHHLNFEDQEILKGPLLSIIWYPEETFIRFLVAVDSLFGNANYARCEEIGYYSAQKSVSTVYKIFIRLGDPSFILKSADRLWESNSQPCHIPSTIN